MTDELHRIFTLYDAHGIGNFPLKRVMTGDAARHYFHKLEEYEEVATRKVTGHFLMSRRLYDWSFMVYAYRYGDVTYAFAWETPYDELHRGYGGGPTTWYDHVSQGQPISMRVNPRAPHEHFVTDRVFRPLNRGVTYLDPDAVG